MNVDTTTQVADFMENNVDFHIAIHVYSIKTIIVTFAWRTNIQWLMRLLPISIDLGAVATRWAQTHPRIAGSAIFLEAEYNSTTV